MTDIRYINEDPPVKAVPMAAKTITVYREGIKLLGRVLIPFLDREEEKAPVVFVLHGFPGNEKFIDLSQALRRCGFVIVNSGFAGVWGCSGSYRFSTLPEDLKANIEYVKEHADELHADIKRMYIVGHSMGGNTALRALSEGLKVKGAVLLAPCNLSLGMKEDPEVYNDLLQRSIDIITTDTHDINELKKDTEGKLEEWSFDRLAENIDKKLPLLFVGGERDSVCPVESHMNKAVEVLKRRNANVKTVMIDSDHSFQDKRIKLIKTVVEWLINQENS